MTRFELLQLLVGQARSNGFEFRRWYVGKLGLPWQNARHALEVLGGTFAIAFVVGNIFLPRMQGNSLNMDPLIVMLSLAFWGAIWGLPGMFLSTPLTVLSMVILAQFRGSRWIAILLSGDGDPLGASTEKDAVGG